MMCSLIVAAVLGAAAPALPETRQITSSPQNHELDNNDNFSPDQRFLCYDTRETLGPGIDNSQTIEKVEIETGRETLLYKPPASVIGERPAPGVGAVSFSPVENAVIFIHGPFVEEVPVRGPYGKPNRTGAYVVADGSQCLSWADKRDIATDRDTLPGAHRGGTHRHEFTLDGRRIGFTYDDFLLPQYGRTIGYMEKNPKAPAPASHYFALLVPVVPKDTAKPGEIEIAAGDSWVGRHGAMRAFIGKVRNDDGVTYEESLYVVDVPLDLDITTADAGSATRYPAPPKGLTIRRLTHTWAGGIIRGAVEGDRIAYFGKDADGLTQVFIIPSNGSDRAEDPALRPVQATRLLKGAEGNLRWHPSGNTLFCGSENAIVATCVQPGPRFGQSVYLTPKGQTPAPYAMVLSPDGTRIAYNRLVPTADASGNIAKNYAGLDFSQIFLFDFPDEDSDGVADGTPGA